MNSADKSQLLQPFFDELENISKLPDELKENLANSFIIRGVKKNEIILSEGEICKHVWVVLKGLVRSFHYVNDTDVTSRLMKVNHIIISVGSFYTQTPAFETLQAIEPSVLACLHHRQLEEMYNKFPSFNYIGRKLTEHYFFLTEKRLFLLRKQKAIDKYKFFLEQYPGLINEIPLKYVASFLGMSHETLSRVRRKFRST